MNDRTVAYFDDLVERAAVASAIRRVEWCDARPNDCHANCEAYVRRFEGYAVVRGWLAFGGHWFVPHSVVRHLASGEEIDITPDPSDSGAIPFVEHCGSEQDFAILRRGRDGGWLHPAPAGMPVFEQNSGNDLHSFYTVDMASIYGI
jgi:hypothetical protein